jgi:hypothetical protein
MREERWTQNRGGGHGYSLWWRRAAGAAAQLGGRRVQGRRVFVRTVWTSSEDEEGSRKVSTGVEGGLQAPAMARRQDPPGGGARTKGERCRA